MIPSIATVTLGGDLPDRFAAAAEAGFQAVELFDADVHAFGGSAASVRRLVDDAGLKVASYFPLREIEGVAQADRQTARDRASAYMDDAAELGAPMVMMCSATGAGMSGDLAALTDDLSRLADLAATRDLRLAYEALSWGQHVFDYQVAARLVAAVDHPSFGLVLDSFHIFARGHTLASIAKIPADQIFLVQISDSQRLNLGYLDWSRRYRTLPGRGNFDLAEFTRLVRMTGYDGVFSLECFNDELRSEPVRLVAASGYKAMQDLWNGAATTAG